MLFTNICFFFLLLCFLRYHSIFFANKPVARKIRKIKKRMEEAVLLSLVDRVFYLDFLCLLVYIQVT